MNYVRNIRAVGVAVAPLMLGASLAGYSPLGCGCIDTWQSLAFALDLPAEDWHQVTPREILKGFDRKFRGQLISRDTLPDPDGEDVCGERRNSRYRCVYWLWGRGSLQKGVGLRFALPQTIDFSGRGSGRCRVTLPGFRKLPMPNSSLERSGNDKVRASRPCAARAQLER